MKAIEEAIDKSLLYEKTVRLIQIERQIAIREVFGEERWNTILLLVHEARMSERWANFLIHLAQRALSLKR